MGHAMRTNMDFLVSSQEWRQDEDVKGAKVGLPGFSLGTASR
jgi:hypothetical protein